MNVLKALRAERLIAKRYEERGYVVVPEPPESAIPFPLGPYHPDFLATKGEEHLLIEVKSRGSRANQDAYVKLSNEVERHPGWKFLLVTVDDDDLEEFADSSPRNLGVGAIRDHLRQLDPLLKSQLSAGLFLPQLWLAYVGALRLLIAREGIAAEPQTDLSLLNRAYSDGVIAIEEYERARRLLKLRNEAAHSLNTAVALDECTALREMVDVLLNRLDGAEA
jgi:hypothetical protein